MKYTAQQFLAEANHHANELAEMLEDAAGMALLREQAKGAHWEAVAWAAMGDDGLIHEISGSESLIDLFCQETNFRKVPLYTAPRAAVPDGFAETVAECVRDIRKHAKQVHDLPLLQQDLRRLANRIERRLRAAPSDGGEQGEGA